MTPEISEFSYGFALTNEIVGWAPVSAAPLFPSLIEEGKVGGGYDVKLDLPGLALYLQFKRSDCMVRSNAREIQKHNLNVSLPFYRFKIAEAGKSDQHELLRVLESDNNLVFYAAPEFHKLAEINHAWNASTVAARSVFVSPSSIGKLDGKSHHVAFKAGNAWLCSEPKRISVLSASQLVEVISVRLDEDPRPLGTKLPEMIESARSARRLAQERSRMQRSFFETTEIYSEDTRARRVPTRSPAKLHEPQQLLRDLADEAAKNFDAQLIIVQPQKSK